MQEIYHGSQVGEPGLTKALAGWGPFASEAGTAVDPHLQQLPPCELIIEMVGYPGCMISPPELGPLVSILH